MGPWPIELVVVDSSGATDCSGAQTRSNGHQDVGRDTPIGCSDGSGSTEESSKSAISEPRGESTSFTTTTGLTTWGWHVIKPSAAGFGATTRATAMRASGTGSPGSASGRF